MPRVSSDDMGKDLDDVGHDPMIPSGAHYVEDPRAKPKVSKDCLAALRLRFPDSISTLSSDITVEQLRIRQGQQQVLRYLAGLSE